LSIWLLLVAAVVVASLAAAAVLVDIAATCLAKTRAGVRLLNPQ